jgi:hypothetical protein
MPAPNGIGELPLPETGELAGTLTGGRFSTIMAQPENRSKMEGTW